MSRLRIAMYGGTLRHWGTLYPNALTEDVPSPGGTELAMMQVARGLARRGHQVTVFADCEPGAYEGVDYVKADAAVWLLGMLPHDVVVSWQDALLFVHPIKARLKVLISESAHLGLGQAAPLVDRYFAISRFSAKLLLDSDPYADPSRMWITRNGIDTTRYYDLEQELAALGSERNHHRMVWASSPDRGLHHLLPIFRRVKEQVPDAELHVCYDFDRTLQSYRAGQPGSAFQRFLEVAAQLKAESGVTFYQHLSQPQLARLMLSSGILTYPCDPISPTETYCNVISEALAAGMVVVQSGTDCLQENYGDVTCELGLPIDHEEWARRIVEVMSDADKFERLTATDYARSVFDYNHVAYEWERFFEGYLDGRETESDRSLAAVRDALALVPHG